TVAKADGAATRLAIGGRRGSGPTATRRAAPNTHADSGGPAPQSRAAVPGTVPRPVPILIRSQLRGHSEIDGPPSSGEGPVGLGSRAGRVVRRFLLLRGAVAGVGWTWDDASASSPFSLRQPRADLACPPTHRRGVARYTTADGECGSGRRPIKAAGC